MPRGARLEDAGVVVHVITRGNERKTIFHEPRDYDAFMRLVTEAVDRAAVDLLAWCLMPNHVHLVARLGVSGSLGRFMQWLLTTHTQRYRVRRGTVGHIWQGRYKSFPIQVDRHLLTVMRYVERNPVRAGIAHRACEWRWSSLNQRVGNGAAASLLSPSPVDLPESWENLVDEPLTASDLAQVRACVQRGAPFGDPAWARGAIDRFGLHSTVRRRGRPARV